MRGRSDIYLKCNDGCNILNVSNYDDEILYSFIMYHGFENNKLSLWKRIKLLFRGYIDGSDIVVSKDDMIKLRDYINIVIK
jgi:hypothetical protein